MKLIKADIRRIKEKKSIGAQSTSGSSDETSYSEISKLKTSGDISLSAPSDGSETGIMIKNAWSVQSDRYAITCERFIMKFYSLGYENVPF